jgi:hypothetical protein
MGGDWNIVDHLIPDKRERERQEKRVSEKGESR